MKNILMVAYFFPPFSDSGVYRVVKLVKYMPSFSCMPLVLCARDPYALCEDKSLLREVPGEARVYRAGSLLPMRWFRRTRASFVSGDVVAGKGRLKQKAGFVLRKLFRTVFIDLMVPDMMLPWAPVAYMKGKTICRSEPVDVIFATDPPSDYLAAAALSKRLNIPLVIELRDSWTLRHYGSPKKSLLRKKIEDKLERGVFHRARKIIFISPLMMKRYAEKYPEFSSKFCVIPNGFDEEDFREERVSSRGDIFHLLHAGRVSDFRNPSALFQAVREMADEKALDKDRILISFTGDFSMLYRQDISRLGLENVIRVIPHKPHSDIIRDMTAADALLLISGDDAEITTGKLYEYLGANRPVLALAPVNGEAARIIHETRAGIVAQQDNVQEIKRALGLILQMGKQREWSNLQKNVIPYTRRNLARQVCDIFHSVTL